MTDPLRPLTMKQAAFARAYFESGNAAEAYRTCYDVQETQHSDRWVYTEASQMLDHPGIIARLKELEKEAALLAIYTRRNAMDELEKARNGAMDAKQFGPAVSAIQHKIKLFGLDRPQRWEVSGPGGGPIKTETSAREILAGRLARLSARAGEDGDAGGDDGGTGAGTDP